MKKICVIGTGYVGLVQGVLLADFGMQVVCMDVNKEKIDMLNRGEVPIYEPGLGEIMEKNVKAGRLSFTTDMKAAVEQSQVIFIAVGTPPADDGSADLQYVMNVAQEIGRYMNAYKVVVNKSTVPVGTGKIVRGVIQKELVERGSELKFDVVSNPEFLREGKAVKDCQNPDRVVLGCENECAEKIMKEVYEVLFINQTPFVITNVETAEMIKYASNAFLAVKISFINEMALLAEKVGANVQEIAKAMGMDGRISPKFLHAGPGYGGSCFPKDTKAIASIGREHGEEMMVIEAAITANEKQKIKMVKKILGALGTDQSPSDRTVAVWGLSFKPETDDMREAPALDIIRALCDAKVKVRAFCPRGMKEAKWRLEQHQNAITYCEDEYQAVQGADALVIMTEWNQFRGADLDRVKSLMKDNFLFDLRNIYKRHTIRDKGFRYYGVGRG